MLFPLLVARGHGEASNTSTASAAPRGRCPTAADNPATVGAPSHRGAGSTPPRVRVSHTVAAETP